MHNIRSDFGSHSWIWLIKPNADHQQKKWMIPFTGIKEQSHLSLSWKSLELRSII